MKRPEFPNSLVGARIKTIEREGTIDSIGKLSDDPWVLFDDNIVPIRCTWESIGIVELEQCSHSSDVMGTVFLKDGKTEQVPLSQIENYVNENYHLIEPRRIKNGRKRRSELTD